MTLGEKTTAATLRAISASQTPWLKNATLFDVYRPKVVDAKNEKSLAVRLTLSRDDSTLTEEAIESTVHSILQALTAHVGARLRT